MSKGRPVPVRCPAAFSAATRSGLLVLGPMRRISSAASVGVFFAVPGWVCRAVVISSVAPVCQLIPIRAVRLVGFREQGDVGDEGAEQPFAVPGGGRVGVEQGRQVGDQCFQVGACRQRRQRRSGWRSMRPRRRPGRSA